MVPGRDTDAWDERNSSNPNGVEAWTMKYNGRLNAPACQTWIRYWQPCVGEMVSTSGKTKQRERQKVLDLVLSAFDVDDVERMGERGVE